jgi:hypothetical protein
VCLFPTKCPWYPADTRRNTRISPAQDQPYPPPEQLIAPLRHLLRPLVRLLLRSGITFPVLADLLRSLYVDVAIHDLLLDRRSRTDSRITLLTGVHRKEVRHLRQQPAATTETPAVVTLSSHIIARWLGSPSYTDASGKPLPLLRTARSADMPSFEALVTSVTTDVRPRTVLDDWLTQGLVTVDAEDRVQLDVAAFVPRPGREEQLFYFARNLHDHIAAASDNILAAGSAPFLDRSVHYDGLTAASATRLEAAAREAAQRLLVEVNRLALELVEAQDAQAGVAGDAGEPIRRVNLGVYLFLEQDQASAGA